MSNNEWLIPSALIMALLSLLGCNHMNYFPEPIQDFELSINPVQIQSILETEDWIYNCDVYACRMPDKHMQKEYIGLIFVPRHTFTATGISSNSYDFGITGYTTATHEGMKPVIVRDSLVQEAGLTGQPFSIWVDVNYVENTSLLKSDGIIMCSQESFYRSHLAVPEADQNVAPDKTGDDSAVKNE